ncbi:MAG: response regulator [Chloroflexota bacterium]|nr:response regulator [Chloroflexota bacterium]
MADRKSPGEQQDTPEAKPAAQRVPVVGIGASAGGVQALKQLFEALPADTGMAFVVVTHLDPTRESVLDEILQRHTEMPVNQVAERLEVEANHVYVIPPARRILITDTHLDTSDFEEPRGRRRPIDYFFRRLAEVHRDCVAIVLSGTGTDGAVGVKAIKEQGGLRSRAERTLLVQMTRELLFNVVKHAKTQQAQLRLERVGDNLHLHVEDKGAGSDVKAVTDPAGPRRGYGLHSIAERLHLLGGRMELASTPGEGSRITLVAPCQGVVRQHNTKREEGNRERPRMHRIFLVEDHAIIRESICDLIEEAPDLTVCGSAATVAEALQKVPDLDPDLLLVDLSLPDGNGYELIKELQAGHRAMPAVIISGHPSNQYRAIARRAGAAEYVDKMDAHLTLVPTLRKVLDDSQSADTPPPQERKSVLG